MSIRYEEKGLVLALNKFLVVIASQDQQLVLTGLVCNLRFAWCACIYNHRKQDSVGLNF